MLLAPLVAATQQTQKVYRIGVLSPEVPPPGLLEIMRDELRGLVYVAGIRKLDVDVIVTVNTLVAHAVKKSTTTVAQAAARRVPAGLLRGETDQSDTEDVPQFLWRLIDD